MGDIELKTVKIEKPEDMNFILGQSHFIKTVEDVYEAMVSSVPSAKFAVAFCEASASCKIRCEGNDEDLKKIAIKNAENVAAGHSFIVFMKDAFPLNVLNKIQSIPEVCGIFCATANPTKVILAEGINEKEPGRAILGVIDGHSPLGVENAQDIKWRKELLRKINYKL